MRIVVAMCALTLTAACAGTTKDAAPPADAFAQGTCRAAAHDVLALGRASARLGDGHTISSSLRSQLRDAQADLDELAVAAEPSYQKAFDALVQSTGIVRIRADGNTYDPSLGKQMQKDYQAVLAVCT